MMRARAVSVAIIATLAACSSGTPVGGTTQTPTSRPRASGTHTARPVVRPSSTTTASSSGGGPATMQPPRPGSYFYDGTVETPSGTNDVTLTVRAGAPSAVSGGMKQREDFSASGTEYAEVIEWLAGRVVVVQRITKDTSGKTKTCTYNPPATDIETPLRVGAHWTSNHSCEGQPNIEVRVDRRETVRAGGRNVATFVIIEHAVVQTSAGRVDVTQSDWFSVADRIPIKLTQVQKTQDGKTYMSQFLVRSTTPA